MHHDLKVFNKPTGKRGEWLVTVQGIGELPVIHNTWLRAGHYHERLLKGEDVAALRGKRREKFIDALTSRKMAVLQKDAVVDGANGQIFQRDGYLSVWNVDNIVVHDDGLVELDLMQPAVGVFSK